MLTLSLAAIAWYILLHPLAQDPFTVAPHAYKHQFENDWVRVVRVRYGPREKIASHDHPRTNTVYVYLRDSGPVRFTHTGEEKFTVDRPAVKAGGFRLGRAVTETHEVESLSDAPTDFLRIELKTVAADSQKFRGRYPPEAHPTDRNSQQARFDNGQVRILRVTCAARSKCGPYRLATPSLWVAITPARLKMSGKTRAASDLEMESGQTLWVEPGDLLRLENIGAAPAEFLRLELKTKPAGNS